MMKLIQYGYLAAFALLLFGCIGPSPTPTPTPAPSTPVTTPTPTATPTPVETTTPEETPTPMVSETPVASATPTPVTSATPVIGGSPSEVNRDECDYLGDLGGFGRDSPGGDHPRTQPGTGTGYSDQPCAQPGQ